MVNTSQSRLPRAQQRAGLWYALSWARCVATRRLLTLTAMPSKAGRTRVQLK
jgi:hypothetical protein